jgi:AAA+ ATPase superfamily predicted ATPase
MIGRKKEIDILNDLYNSGTSQFVAICGRRRVGKTYLVNELFRDRITFRHAGISPIEKDENIKSPLKYQLQNFYNSLAICGAKPKKCPKDWMEAFLMLELYLQSVDDGSRQLIFIDELPWLDTPKSGFITAFEAFWNNWGCSRRNLMLIVCGSATSWMSDKLINNHGGLYNRITYEIKLEPFTLRECEEYFQEKNIKFSRYDITSAYMACGGIPYYLSYFYGGNSLAQNIDRLFFEKNAPLHNEFDRLFNSIFTNSEFMKSLVKTIGKKRIGLTRDEILSELSINTNGALTDALRALMASEFIIKYTPFGLKKDYYKLIDPFCNFYLRFVEDTAHLEGNFWLFNIVSPKVAIWRGLAFENVCFNHIDQIKEKLGIRGVGTEISSWYYDNGTEKGQIDLLLKRNDNIIDVCECKFYAEDFAATEADFKKANSRCSEMYKYVPKKFSPQSILITTFGLTRNEYSSAYQNVVTLDDLFES